MRYYPAAIGLSLVLAITASAGLSKTEAHVTDPRAMLLVEEGIALHRAGDLMAAGDYLESALALDPAAREAYIALAEVARSQGMQGKAIRLYREAQQLYPDDIAAIAGEGEALVERGAVDKARVNLSRIERLCTGRCNEVSQLNAALAAGPPQRVVTAEAVAIQPSVEETP